MASAGGRLAASAAVITIVAAGCATMPTTGPVHSVAVVQGNGQTQDNPQPIPVPPGAGWSYPQIVSGFLAASTSFANDHAVAREYLAPGAAQAWQPGWAATVVGSRLKITIVAPPRNVLPGGQQTATVEFTGQRLATLTSSGQYVTSSGAREVDPFTLVNNNGEWRISQLPSSTSLILTKPDFERDYKPRNLYFFGPSGTSLVPEPVFVPQRHTHADPAGGLVSALIKGPTGWQSGATWTDFPAGTKALSVKILGPSAIVDLGGSAAKASPEVIREMAAQLVWTLTGTSYSTPDIDSVLLEINGVVQHPYGQQLQLLSAPAYGHMLPPASATADAYLLGSSGGVKVLPGSTQPARQLPGPAGISKITFSSIAISPDEGEFAGIFPESKGCLVYSGLIRRGAALISRPLSGGTCTSLSWDSQGNIWAAAGNHVWMLPSQGGAAVPVLLPAAAGHAAPSASLPSSEVIDALRVAPDGVRVAMIVSGTNQPAEVLLGAISRGGVGAATRTYIGQNGTMVAVGTDIFDPTSLSWYDADHLLVLGHAGGSQAHEPQLYDVPLTGGPSAAITTSAGTVSITAAGSDLVAGTSGGQILMSSGTDLSWRQVGQGRGPVYPG
jgi:hypothetical protein